MEIIHSAATKPSDLAAEAQKVSPLQEGNLLAGAALDGGYDGEVVDEYWKPFTAYDLGRVSRTAEEDGIVLGTCAMEIEERLRKRYDMDAPPGGTYVVRVDNYELNSNARSGCWRRRNRSGSSKLTGWVILDRPYFETVPLSQLATICLQYGPVIVDHEGDNDLPYSDDTWERAGFTTRERAHGLGLQVNYNPRAIKRRPWLKEKRAVEKRLEGFPDDVLHALFRKLHPNNYPPGHPFRDIVKGPALEERRGWGYSRNLSFSPREILQLRDLTLKLWPGQRWWRTKDDGERYYGGDYSWKGRLAEALLYVHGVEQRCAKELEEKLATARHYYSTRLDEDDPERPTEEEWVKEWMEMNDCSSSRDSKLRFCRWLRSEARAIGLKMPKKPIIPLSPAQKERQAKKRKKAAAKRRRERRRQCQRSKKT